MNRAWLIIAVLLIAPAMTQAHEVPDRVNISVIVKPEADHLVILVRMPANALIDILLPTLPTGNWIDLAHAGELAEQGANVWIADMLSFREGDKLLPRPQLIKLRLSRVNDPSFRNFDDALSRVNGAPLSPETLALQEQLTVDALLQTPIDSPASRFYFEPRFARLGVQVETSLTYLPAGGGTREFRYLSDPELFELDTGKLPAAARFVREGFNHYFDESDYLLLAICTALAFRRVKALLTFASIFAAAQALSLFVALDAMSAAFWLRSICGTAIAAAIVYMGSEAIIDGEGRRFGLAFALGAIFGYGFWVGLQPIIQFGGSHLVTAGAGFIVGAIAAEMLVLVLCAIGARLVFWLSRSSRGAIIVIAGAVIHIAWNRLLERADAMALVPLENRGIDSTTLLLSGLAILAVMVTVSYFGRSSNSASPSP